MTHIILSSELLIIAVVAGGRGGGGGSSPLTIPFVSFPPSISVFVHFCSLHVHVVTHSCSIKVSHYDKTKNNIMFSPILFVHVLMIQYPPIHPSILPTKSPNTVEPRYNEVLGTMKITLLYQVSHYIRVKQQRNTKSWDQQNYLVIRGFCYIRPLYNEVPLYLPLHPLLHLYINFSKDPYSILHPSSIIPYISSIHPSFLFHHTFIILSSIHHLTCT